MLDAALSEFMNAEDLKINALADEKLPTEERAEAERVLSPYQYATSFQRANIPGGCTTILSSKPRPQRPMVGRLRHRAQARCHVGVMRIVMNGGK
jgi:hypothetical protein